MPTLLINKEMPKSSISFKISPKNPDFAAFVKS